MSIFLLRRWLKRASRRTCWATVVSSHPVFPQTWAFLSGIRWIWVVILGRKLNPAQLLKSACCWGRPTQFCSLFLFPVFFCSGGVWRPFGFFSISFGACNQVWRSVVTHQPDGEVLSELLSLRFKVSFLTYHDLLRPVFTVFAQIRCVWNVIKQYTLKMVCPGYPPQCHSLFLDFFFFHFVSMQCVWYRMLNKVCKR